MSLRLEPPAQRRSQELPRRGIRPLRLRKVEVITRDNREAQTTPSRWTRFLLAAVFFHAGLLVLFASLRMAVALPVITAIFETYPVPPPKTDFDPFVPLRQFEYKGGGSGGGGSGGPILPPSYKMTILSPEARQANQTVGEVIGIRVGENLAHLARPEGAPTGVGAPFGGDGTGRFGTGSGGNEGFGQRFGAQRAQAIRQHQGADEAERAVVAALRWLKEHQLPDGSWGEGPYRLGISGLATLAFLGHGETPDSGEFGLTLNRAFKYLTTCYDPNANVYEQAIVTYALAEGYGMSRSPSLREPLQRCVSLLLKAQQTTKPDPRHIGGWRYSLLSQDADTSVSGWCVQALVAARLAGISVPQTSLDAASEFFWNMYRNGVFGYDRPSGGGSTTTSIGVLSQMFLGRGTDPRLKESLEKLKQQRFDWAKTEAPFGMVAYLWYYLTQAMFQAGGVYWEYWNAQFRQALVERQADDGHWDLPALSKETEFNRPPVYSTALFTLMLEVYYRYLPTYQPMTSSP